MPQWTPATSSQSLSVVIDYGQIGQALFSLTSGQYENLTTNGV